jgi:UDP-GlcNAc:undecaprenyl-phosphate GlcNAc-1-phosphate transferase
MKTYIIVFFGSALLAIFGTPIATRIARRVRLLDLPGVRKIHAAPVPRIGGVIIAFAVLSLVLSTMLLDNTVGLAFRKNLLSITALLATSLSMLMLGLVDDVRGVRALVKLLCQVAAATAVCAVGIRIDSINLPGLGEVAFGVLSWPITIMWIVGITNAVNLIDGLDGLAAGISAITCGVIAVVAIYTGQLVMAVLMLALVGSLTGFLFFNSNPAKVFMGDSGTLFVGFMTAAASVMCTTKSEMLVGLALPALALGLPIFDTCFSILRRILERRSIFAPDRRHIHHRLLAMGLKQRYAVIAMYLVTLVAAGMGVLMMFVRDKRGGMLLLLGAIALLLVVFRLVGAVRLRESLAILRRNLAFARQAKEESHCFERMQLRIREAKTFEQWWAVLCDMADEMDFVWLSLSLSTGQGTTWTSVWRRPGDPPPPQDVVTMSVPVGRRRQHVFMMEAGLKVNGSLEAVGHRAGLLGRLIDEYEAAEPADVLGGLGDPEAGGDRTASRLPGAVGEECPRRSLGVPLPPFSARGAQPEEASPSELSPGPFPAR